MVFVLFILGITSVLAASGLVYIPGLSQILYQEPEPTRVVKLLEKENLEEIIQERIEDKVKETGEKIVEVEFSEQEITTLIGVQKIAEGNLTDLQIVIEKDYLELYGKIRTPMIHVVFILKAVPKTEDDEIYLTPTNLQVGALKVPIEWAMKISNIDELFNKPIQISNDLKIKKIKLQKGKVIVEIEVLNVEESIQYIPSTQSTPTLENT